MNCLLLFHLFRALLILVTRVFCSCQVERLRKDIEMQNKKKDVLGAWASMAEKKIQKLNSKLQKVIVPLGFVKAFINCSMYVCVCLC